MRISVALFLILLASSACKKEAASMLKDSTNSKYKVGQVWSYKTRPQEPDSSFTVVKVESLPKLGNIIHVSISGLRVKNSREPKGYVDFIAHMPFAEEAIDKSVVKLLKENVVVGDYYKEGYEDWKHEFNAGEAGIFTVSVADGADVMEKILNQ